MKKRFLAFICMIGCIIGLTACGDGEALTEAQQKRRQNAQSYSEELVGMFANYLCKGFPLKVEDYTLEEVEYLFLEELGIHVDGYAVSKAVSSFRSGIEVIGEVTGTGEAKVVFDGSQIVVELEVKGEKKDAVAEIVLSNDMFFKLESASLNPKNTFGELMARAGLNTLIGMGTVFAVLILICLLISCFGVIPKLQAAAAKRREAKQAEEQAAGIDNAVAQIAAREEESGETDDLELIAVISAAIAASEGAASADGFVVRSIRRRA